MIEQVPNTFPSLFWAYTAVWLILGFYMFSLIHRLGKLEDAQKKKSSKKKKS